MSKMYSVLFLILSITLVSCGTAETDVDVQAPVADVEQEADQEVEMDENMDQDEMEDTDEDEMDEDSMADSDVDYSGEYTLNADESEFAWAGAKIVGGGHDGVIQAQSGTIVIEDNELVSGVVVIDMTTIKSTDNGGDEGLDSHLKADDFFAVETYPTATLTVVSATQNDDDTYTFNGTLEILGTTNDIQFVGELEAEEGEIEMETEFTINRDDYGIGSGFKGAALKDEVEFDVDVEFTK